MSSRLNPYLSFNGNARQAMEFYAGVFGGDLAFNTFAEIGNEDSPDTDRIMHAILITRPAQTP
jgi:PhnB protein